jgi:hypothetical protein
MADLADRAPRVRVRLVVPGVCEQVCAVVGQLDRVELADDPGDDLIA